MGARIHDINLEDINLESLMITIAPERGRPDQRLEQQDFDP